MNPELNCDVQGMSADWLPSCFSHAMGTFPCDNLGMIIAN